MKKTTVELQLLQAEFKAAVLKALRRIRGRRTVNLVIAEIWVQALWSKQRIATYDTGERVDITNPHFNGKNMETVEATLRKMIKRI